MSPSVTKASIALTICPADVLPVCTPEEILLPLNFSAESNIQKLSGSYTPNNDFQYLTTFSATNPANFMLLVLDQPGVLYLQCANGQQPVAGLLVNRFFYTSLQNYPSPLTSIFLYGPSTGPQIPMQQGVPCNWTLVYGVATVS